MDIIEGRINIESNEYMQKVFKDSMKRAEVSGLHAVNVFSVDPIEGDLRLRAGILGYLYPR